MSQLCLNGTIDCTTGAQTVPSEKFPRRERSKAACE